MLIDGLHASATVAIGVLVQIGRDVLVIGRAAIVGDGEHNAELVAIDIRAFGIQNIDRSSQVSSRHRVDGDGAGGNGIAAILVQ